MRRLPVSLIAVAVGFALAGCSSNLAHVSGRVTLDGEPLTRGRVTFQADGKPMGVAEIQSDGSYQIRTGTLGGISPGEYGVTVTAYETKSADNELGEPIPVLLTPKRYNSLETSGLKANVEAGSNTIDFALTSQPD